MFYKKEPFLQIYRKDHDSREVNVYKLTNVKTFNNLICYPIVLLREIKNNNIINPINEKTMSLKDVDFKIDLGDHDAQIKENIKDNLFYFVYNTENYFHFLYDSIPYLISFLRLKKEIPDLKLLMNYSNLKNNKFYPFVLELLNLLSINEQDIEIIKNNTLYSNLFVSDSYTHGADSNLPPTGEVYDFYKYMCDLVPDRDDTPRKIYVSRRTWLHNNLSNIGTDYTSRRIMKNEDNLVEFLKNKGFSEIFAENLSITEKIQIFRNAETVIGPIGGGMSNVLFSSQDCDVVAIISPTFLEVNNRFKFSMNQAKLHTFCETKHTEDTEFKLYMRVKHQDLIGEIIAINDDKISLAISDKPISGWPRDIEHRCIEVDSKECIKLDDGLNSPFFIDLPRFKSYYNEHVEQKRR